MVDFSHQHSGSLNIPLECSRLEWLDAVLDSQSSSLLLGLYLEEINFFFNDTISESSPILLETAQWPLNPPNKYIFLQTEVNTSPDAQQSGDRAFVGVAAWLAQFPVG